MFSRKQAPTPNEGADQSGAGEKYQPAIALVEAHTLTEVRHPATGRRNGALGALEGEVRGGEEGVRERERERVGVRVGIKPKKNKVNEGAVPFSTVSPSPVSWTLALAPFSPRRPWTRALPLTKL